MLPITLPSVIPKYKTQPVTQENNLEPVIFGTHVYKECMAFYYSIISRGMYF